MGFVQVENWQSGRFSLSKRNFSDGGLNLLRISQYGAIPRVFT